MELIYKNEVYQMIGACFEFYNEIGSGCLEDVHQLALVCELSQRAIPFVQKAKLEIRYKGKLLTAKYEPDFVIHSKIIMEIKAVKRWQTNTGRKFTTTSRLPHSGSIF